MKLSKFADKIIIVFLLISAAIILYRVIFLGIPFKQSYYRKVYGANDIDGFKGCTKGFCT